MDKQADSGMPPEEDGSSGRTKGGRDRKGTPDAAFDHWLERGLHAMYDNIANEPIPEELLRLIEQDRGEGREQ